MGYAAIYVALYLYTTTMICRNSNSVFWWIFTAVRDTLKDTTSHLHERYSPVRRTSECNSIADNDSSIKNLQIEYSLLKVRLGVLKSEEKFVLVLWCTQKRYFYLQKKSDCGRECNRQEELQNMHNMHKMHLKNTQNCVSVPVPVMPRSPGWYFNLM